MNTSPLLQEIARYNTELHSLLENEGRFAVIQGQNPIEVYDTYDDALKAGYSKYGLTPFLVQKISRIPQVLNFTRHMDISCQV